MTFQKRRSSDTRPHTAQDNFPAVKSHRNPMLALLSATFPDATAVDLTQSAIDLCEALRPLTRELEQTKAADRDRDAALWSRSNSYSLDMKELEVQLREREKVGGVFRKDNQATSSKNPLPGDEPPSHVSSTGDDQYDDDELGGEGLIDKAGGEGFIDKALLQCTV